MIPANGSCSRCGAWKTGKPSQAGVGLRKNRQTFVHLYIWIFNAGAAQPTINRVTVLLLLLPLCRPVRCLTLMSPGEMLRWLRCPAGICSVMMPHGRRNRPGVARASRRRTVALVNTGVRGSKDTEALGGERGRLCASSLPSDRTDVRLVP